MILNKEFLLLRVIQTMVGGTMECVKSFLADSQLVRLTKGYEENKGRRVVEVGLNLFILISDIYHKENFHSDVLKIVLDPSSPHKEGDKYLQLFIEYLNTNISNLHINPADYTDVVVFREQGRVDLMIRGDRLEKHAIIIENKMNNAPDMHLQIPRYLEYVQELGCICDAIVYLRLSKTRYPDTTDWTLEEQTEIYAKLVCINAYDDSPKDLVSGWINKCEKVSTHIDAQLILRQYGTLLQKLGGEIMNKPIMSQFFTMMLDPETFKTAQSLSSMWDDLTVYRVEAIIEEFRSDVAPFKKIDNWKDGDAYFTGLMWRGAHLGIDIDVDTDGYTLRFWDRNDGDGIKSMAKAAIREIGCDQTYPVLNGSFRRKFAFPSQHAELIQYVRNFKQDLKALK